MSELGDSRSAPVSETTDLHPALAHILFVDDEENILNSLRRLFRSRQDWQCHFANGPAAAVSIIAEYNIAVIVSDHRMPEMTGAELLAIIRDKRPNTVRMMLTGQASLRDVERAVNAGEIFRFVLKPWRDEDLVEAVRSAVAHFLIRQENEALKRKTQQQNEELKVLNSTLESRVEMRTEQLKDALHTAKALNAKLEASLRAAMCSFFTVVELAHPKLGDHCRRVAALAKKVAAKMEIAESRLWEVETAALLHDLGKLGLPVYLIEKDLSVMRTEEIEVYRMHAQEGADRLRKVAGMDLICETILQHHERYNGSGFPAGLKESQISDHAYIVGMCDYCDNLISRNYESQEHHLQEARRKVELTSGRDFPDRVAKAMLSVLEEEEVQHMRKDAQKVSLQNLTPNMKLARNLYTVGGTLLLAENGELTRKAIARIRALTQVDRVAGDIYVYYAENANINRNRQTV